MVPNESTRLVSNDRRSSSSNINMWICFSIVFLHVTLIGFNVGLPNPMIASVQQTFELDSWQVGFLVAIGPFATAISALVGGLFADSFGRWALSAFAVLISLIGSLVMALAQDYTQLFLGRSLAGIHLGLSLVATALYTAEASPRHLRGSFGTCIDVFINIGIFGAAAGALVLTQWYGFTADQDWRCITWLIAGLASLFLLTMWFLPETPRWYAMKNRWEEAENVLKKLVSDPEEVQTAIEQLREEAKTSLAQNRSGWTQVGALFCCNPQLRLPLVRAHGMAFFHISTGIPVLTIFSTTLLQDEFGKTTAQIGAVVVFAFKLAAILVSTFLVDSVGRRPLLLASSVIMASGYLMWALAPDFTWTAAALIVCAVGFSIGMGPLNFVIPSEVLPLAIRAWGVAACGVTTRLTEAAIGLATLPAMDAFGQGPCILVLGAICCMAAAFFWAMMPENKQLTVEKSSSYA